MTPRKINGHVGAVTITNEEIGELPLKAFAGPVAVINHADLLPGIFDEINQHDVAGFDTETRPTFKKGQLHSVSLLQIAIPAKVFLIRLQHTGIDPHIQQFFQNEKIVKAGIGLRDDIIALQRLQNFEAKGFVDLAPIAKQVGLQVESVKKLTALLLGFRISKSAQTSNWETEKLTQKQIEYAATDAWVCRELYHKLSKLSI
jgi:ribonuclease D